MSVPSMLPSILVHICLREYVRMTIFSYAYICQEAYTMAMKDARLTTLEEAFKAFADPTRLRIPQPTASRHLAYLRRNNLVETRKEGLWVHYKLAALDEPVMRVLMSAVTHVLSHCDAVGKDRARLEAQTGCCVPTEPAHLECCVPAEARSAKRANRKVP